MRLIIITGTSGAGKMTAFHYFEDIGYAAVDNVPPALLPDLARNGCGGEGGRLLAVVDARCGEQVVDLPDALVHLAEQGTPAELIYLDASDEVLVRRFKETRRPHPLYTKGKGSILRAIQAERQLLGSVREQADKVIDTSALSGAGLCRALADVTGERTGPRLQVTIESFGFKHGLPIDADLVFDVRFLANPHYVPELRKLTGRSPEVARYIHRDPLTELYLERMFDFVGFTLPQYVREGKAYLTIAIGCTGGRHRSVTVAEDLGRFLEREGYRVTIFHRDAELRRSTEDYIAPAAEADAK